MMVTIGAQVHFLLDLKLLALLAVANGTPVFAKAALRERFAMPLDGGMLFLDGQPYLGSSKTLRGIALSLIATVFASMLLGFGWKLGALVSLLSMAGDLLSSFLKRRMRLPASSMALGLDQIPEALFPLLLCAGILQLTIPDILAITIVFFVGELVLSRVLYRLRIRDQPY